MHNDNNNIDQNINWQKLDHEEAIRQGFDPNETDAFDHDDYLGE